MSDRPHVLFLVLDSARKDRLSTYGHDRPTTPTLTDLADRAVEYENAFAPAPWTLPSHWSMFTGRFPSEHGVTNGFTDGGLPRPGDVETVAERLSRRGYRTAGFSNNPWVGSLSGLDRGFDAFVEWDLEQSRADGTPTRTRDAVFSRLHSLLGRAANQPQVLLKRRFFTSNLAERAGRWIAAAADDAPTFTFLNLMEAHSPYYPPRSAFRELGLDPPNPIESRLLNVRLLAYVMGKTDLTPARRERVMEFYDASLRFQDRQVERLLGVLEREGILDDALVVVCADHGKTLGEYDRDGRPPHYLRDINVNVPLIVKPPTASGPDRVETPYELTELADLLAGAPPCRDDLVPDAGDALVEDHIPHTGRESTDVTRWRALADRGHKYVRSGDGDEYLFRRGADAVTDDPGRRDEFRERLDVRAEGLVAADDTDRGDGDIGGSVEGQLEDLGYLG